MSDPETFVSDWAKLHAALDELVFTIFDEVRKFGWETAVGGIVFAFLAVEFAAGVMGR